MRIRPLYNLKESVLNLWKNRTNTASSIFVMTFTFAILGIVFIIVMNANAMVKETQSTFDKIAIFLEDDLSSAESDNLYSELKNIDGVKDVIYEDKEAAFKKWKDEEWGKKAHLLDGIDDSPLPNAFHITIKDIKLAKKVVAKIQTLKGIEDIRYYREEVESMIAFGKLVAKIGLGVIAILLILCFFVISNTIKIAVNSRHLEINIMKFVGANNFFIRGPFIIEGILIGLSSSLFSSIIVYSLYKYVVGNARYQDFKMIDGSSPFVIITPMELMNTFVYISVVLGLGIGILGSIRSTKKHLRA